MWGKTFFILLFVFCHSSFGQQIVNPYNVDAIVVSQYEYAVLNTNNGSQCICVVKNNSFAEEAIVVIIGDGTQSLFDNDSSLNGIHILKIKEQIIAVSDFKGSQIIVSNFSSNNESVIVSMLCNSSNFSETKIKNIKKGTNERPN